jgi:hypothetical protein
VQLGRVQGDAFGWVFADGPATVEAGAFLRLGGPDARAAADARVVIGKRTLPLSPRGPSLPPSWPRRIHFPTIVPGSERVESPAPDPAGRAALRNGGR